MRLLLTVKSRPQHSGTDFSIRLRGKTVPYWQKNKTASFTTGPSRRLASIARWWDPLQSSGPNSRSGSSTTGRSDRHRWKWKQWNSPRAGCTSITSMTRPPPLANLPSLSVVSCWRARTATASVWVYGETALPQQTALRVVHPCL